MNAVVKMETAQQILEGMVETLTARHSKALTEALAEHKMTIDGAMKRIDDLAQETDRLRNDLAEIKRQPGPQGERGERGLSGRDGIDGERGPSGRDGRDGSDGMQGKDGAPGLRGEPGVDGIPGERGPRGEKGDRGERGERGEKGDPGQSGREGKDGKDGRDGRDGINGNDGRDAAQIDVLEEISEGRVYARGTWARRDSGLWRFTGVEWQCIIDGVKEIDVEQIDERSFRICTVYSSGTKSYRDFNVNSLIYREVWEPKSYSIGDCVTWDGSMWVAMRSASELDKPGESTAFRLAVKRGRNGKST